ncbi:MAG: hypothetical protein J2P32_07445 [Actinobacteria bacterium]|nr:hypothetical protein [Actinomycetota bacterium]
MKTSRAPRQDTPASSGGVPHYDPRQRLAAARLQHRNPHWLVCWGCHSRRYWAFPLFVAAPGTIISAPGEPGLLAGMRQAEAEAVARLRAGAGQ